MIDCPVCQRPGCPENLFRQYADEQSGVCDIPEVKHLRWEVNALKAERDRYRHALAEIKYEAMPYLTHPGPPGVELAERIKSIEAIVNRELTPQPPTPAITGREES